MANSGGVGLELKCCHESCNHTSQILKITVATSINTLKDRTSISSIYRSGDYVCALHEESNNPYWQTIAEIGLYV